MIIIVSFHLFTIILDCFFFFLLLSVCCFPRNIPVESSVLFFLTFFFIPLYLFVSFLGHVDFYIGHYVVIMLPFQPQQQPESKHLYVKRGNDFSFFFLSLKRFEFFYLIFSFNIRIGAIFNSFFLDSKDILKDDEIDVLYYSKKILKSFQCE